MVVSLAQSRTSESSGRSSILPEACFPLTCYHYPSLLRIKSKVGINPRCTPFYTYVVVRFLANRN